MAGQLLTGTSLDANELLQRAVQVQFSFRGEMFSGLLLKNHLSLLVRSSTFMVCFFSFQVDVFLSLDYIAFVRMKIQLKIQTFVTFV